MRRIAKKDPIAKDVMLSEARKLDEVFRSIVRLGRLPSWVAPCYHLFFFGSDI